MIKILKKAFEKRDEILSWTKDKKTQVKNTCYEVMLHKLCNEKCLFCSQDHESRVTSVKPDDNNIYKRILYWVKEGYTMLWFTWWEPLTHPNILKYIRFAKKAGFNYIRVQTNWTMLWVPLFAEKCIKAWATLFKLSIHHYKPEIHDYLVGLPWALNKVIYWIKEIKRLGGRIWMNIVLTEQNYRDLPEIFLYYLNLWITEFVIIFPLYENSMKEEASKVWFKFSEATAPVIKVLHIFDKLWLKRPLVLNLPLCLLPWYESAIIQTFNGTAVLNLDGSKSNIDDNKWEGKKRVKICNYCEHNKICFWVDQEYIKFWWENEFLEKRDKLEYNFDLDELEIKNYFTEDELCLLEILNTKNNIGVKEIAKIKKDIQVCQHCDDMQKLQIVEESLLKKWYIKVTWEWMDKVYSLKYSKLK